MNDKQNPKRTKSTNAETPLHTIQTGSVTASIWRRQSPAGYVYLDFSLTRSFESLSTGSLGQSRNFFAVNRQELVHAIGLATAWIEQHEASRNPGDNLAA
jgi:hypothetical protein